jgi:hypothetical protein
MGIAFLSSLMGFALGIGPRDSGGNAGITSSSGALSLRCCAIDTLNRMSCL